MFFPLPNAKSMDVSIIISIELDIIANGLVAVATDGFGHRSRVRAVNMFARLDAWPELLTRFG
jgi:hypothetical protein